jgi:Arc/MetJ-type ribon-helix-helix transcriptional regulator
MPSTASGTRQYPLSERRYRTCERLPVENKSVTSASEVKVRLRTKTEILGGRGLEGWQDERIEELVESREYSSKNAVVQDWLADAEKVNQLESELERCWRARRQLLEQCEENQEPVRYAEQRRTAIERREERRDAPVWTRAK